MYKTVIVDDDIDTLGLLDDLFPKSEFDTYLETDGHSACQTIDQIKPDLIVSDVVLLGINGFDIVRHVRCSSRSPVVFLITGKSEIYGKTAYELDVHLFLRKPFDSEEMVAAARRFLRHRREVPLTTQLSRRELDVVTLIARGMTTLEIGGQLGISHKTVAKHRENMMRRLQAKNVADLIVKSGAHTLV